jgi:hypothetical protein
MASHFVRPLVRSPAEFLRYPPRTAALPPQSFLFLCDAPPETLRGTGAGRHVESGAARQLPVRLGRAEDERWYFLGSQPPAHVLLPIAFHDRYFVVLNDAGWEVHQRFAALSLTSEALPWARALCALLCAQPVVLCIEILGRRSLGQGVLDVPPETWRQVLLPDPARLGAAALEALARAWVRLADRPPLRLAAAAEDEAQRELDELVLDLLGWPRTERAALYEETLDWLAARLIKAGSRAGR